MSILFKITSKMLAYAGFFIFGLTCVVMIFYAGKQILVDLLSSKVQLNNFSIDQVWVTLTGFLFFSTAVITCFVVTAVLSLNIPLRLAQIHRYKSVILFFLRFLAGLPVTLQLAVVFSFITPWLGIVDGVFDWFIIAFLSGVCLSPTAIVLIVEILDKRTTSFDSGVALGLPSEVINYKIIYRERRRQIIAAIGIAIARGVAEITVLSNFLKTSKTTELSSIVSAKELIDTALGLITVQNNYIIIILVFTIALFGKAILIGGATIVK